MLLVVLLNLHLVYLELDLPVHLAKAHNRDAGGATGLGVADDLISRAALDTPVLAWDFQGLLQDL